VSRTADPQCLPARVISDLKMLSKLCFGAGEFAVCAEKGAGSNTNPPAAGNFHFRSERPTTGGCRTLTDFAVFGRVNQAKQLGAHVPQGEKSTLVSFWKSNEYAKENRETTPDDTGKPASDNRTRLG
jgi:hypothetical protein